ncbi:MAG: NAD(P)-binding protein [Comamonadaceae bacterium]|nr:NAD(P)-binding protein [Comamonadaceae bacterium]
MACVGAGPASLTVARDLAPLGYEVTVFDGDAKRRRHDPHADPALPPARGGDRRGGRLRPRPRRRVPRRPRASSR